MLGIGGRLRLIRILLVLLLLVPIETMLGGSGGRSGLCGSRLVMLLGKGACSESDNHGLIILLACARWSRRRCLMDQLLVMLLALN